MNWIGLWTLTKREVGRFFSVYRQTVLPGLISSALELTLQALLFFLHLRTFDHDARGRRTDRKTFIF